MATAAATPKLCKLQNIQTFSSLVVSRHELNWLADYQEYTKAWVNNMVHMTLAAFCLIASKY